VDQQEDLERTFSVEGDAATFTLRTGQDSFSWPFGAWGNERLWALRLNADVPLRLEANVGMGEVDLDLTGCTLDDLRVDAGIGRVEVILPAEGDFRADLGGAIGEMVVVVPADLEARIEVDTGITGRQIDDVFRRDGDVYTSAGYAGADRRVDLRVSQAIGNLVIRRGR
jgi:predicted membrane protein